MQKEKVKSTSTLYDASYTQTGTKRHIKSCLNKLSNTTNMEVYDYGYAG